MQSTDYKNSRIIAVIGIVFFLFSITVHFAFADYVGVAQIPHSDIPLNGGQYVYRYNLDNPVAGVYTPANPIQASSYAVGHYAFTYGSGCTNLSYTACYTATNGGTAGIEVYVQNSLFYTILPPENALWGSSNGFWGSTTPLDIAGTLQASVQATGVDIYPLLKFVGIPMGFLIALYLVWLINKTLTPVPEKKLGKTLDTDKEEFIYHSADDLEFKREYGQVKRKRGRPRKNPL